MIQTRHQKSASKQHNYLTINKLTIQTFADIRKVVATNRNDVVRISKVVVDYRKLIAHTSKVQELALISIFFVISDWNAK